jgi:hypothetical protein
VVEAGKSVEPGVFPGVTDVDDEDRLPPTVREEVGVDPCGVEATHRARGKAFGSNRQQEIPGLKRRAESARVVAVGMCSWNSVSIASTATAGADRVLALFPSDMWVASRALPASLRTYSTRSGWILAAVGGHFASSQISRSSASVTGAEAKLFAVRA